MTGADVDRALTEERSLVLTGLNRGMWKFAEPAADLTPFAALDRPVAQALARDAEAVREFLGRS